MTNKLDEDGRREGILIHIFTSLEHVVKEKTEKWHKVFWQISYRDSLSYCYKKIHKVIFDLVPTNTEAPFMQQKNLSNNENKDA